ncbi:MAG: hypothetical protein HWD60_11760 [Defluviicoccus sp.]|nr:MAG: hypothetical protein HWD60_11760 [Defluviicoccus sp.]
MQPNADVPIYSLDDAIAALRAAKVEGRWCGLQFPSCSSVFRSGVVCQIIRQARSLVPDVAVDWLVQCSDEAGLVLAMLRAGVPRVQFDGPDALRHSLNDIAQQYSAVVEPSSLSRVLQTAVFGRTGDKPVDELVQR